MKKAHIITLGCAKNTVDSETMLQLLSEKNIGYAEKLEDANVAIINTCGFIESAKKESIQAILEVAEYKSAGDLDFLIVTGCLSQRYSEELKDELPEVDSFLGTTSFIEIASVIEALYRGERNSYIFDSNRVIETSYHKTTLTPKNFAYLKIAEGCDNLCTYCIIPKLRGKYRSIDKDSLLSQASLIADNGVNELVLIAQDTSKYGMDLYQSKELVPLLRALEELHRFRWIRLLYLYPEDVSDELIEYITQSQTVLPYFDIPIQHINNTVLHRMNRSITRTQIEDILKKIRTSIPNAVIRTTLIVGFPGETNEQFEELHEFIKAAKFDKLGVFAYSAEEGTPAARMEDQVDETVKTERLKQLMQTQQTVSWNLNRKLIGQTITAVIEEKPEEGTYVARSWRDMYEIDGVIYFNSEQSYDLGDVLQLRIVDAMEYDLIGEEESEFSK